MNLALQKADLTRFCIIEPRHPSHLKSKSGQGRNDGGQGGHNAPGAESLWGRRMTGGAPQKVPTMSQARQYSTFASERPQVRTWERQSCSSPWAPSNLVTPLDLGAKKTQWEPWSHAEKRLLQ